MSFLDGGRTGFWGAGPFVPGGGSGSLWDTIKDKMPDALGRKPPPPPVVPLWDHINHTLNPPPKAPDYTGKTLGNPMGAGYPMGPGSGYPMAPRYGPSQYASGASGPAGVGGTGGFGFVNIGQYLNANPNTADDARAGVPETHGAYGASQAQKFNPTAGGFDASGGYTPGMAGIDAALNGVYGRTAAPNGYNTPGGGYEPGQTPGGVGHAGPPVNDGPRGGTTGGGGGSGPGNPGGAPGGNHPQAATYGGGFPVNGGATMPRDRFPGISQALGPRYV